MDLIDPLYIVILLCGLGSGGFVAWRRHSQQLAAWATFAQRHGLTARGLTLQGLCEGRELWLATERRVTGTSRDTVTVLRLDVRDVLPEEPSRALPPDSGLSLQGGWLQAERRGVLGSVEALEELVHPALETAHRLETSWGGRRERARALPDSRAL
jgi:hypothetical protein